MMKVVLVFICVSGFLGVIIGALNSHYFPSFLGTEQIESINVGLRYIFFHVPVILALSLYVLKVENTEGLVRVCKLMASGMFLFAYSIFCLVWVKHIGIKPRFFGLITPLGGLLLITSWGMLIYYTLTKI